MIDREHELPLTRQAALLKLSRSGLYDRPRPVAPADLVVMRRIDELHLDYPFAGSRMLRDLLRGEGVEIGRQRVATMMKRMGITALYRRPNTSKPAPGHKIYPYLLRSTAVERPNQVWAMGRWGDGHHVHPDGAWLRLSRRGGRLVQPEGFVLARLDHDGGRVLPRGGRGGAGEARQAGNLQHGPEPAPAKAGGSQFTGADFTGLLLANAIAISMDGKGSWRDNVFVERLWRSVKYEEVYLRAYDSVGEARTSIGRYLEFYNRKRPHSSP